MVLGHNIQYASGKEWLLHRNYFDNNIFKIIYSFHMPLLMIISGYFFYMTMKKIIEKKDVSTIYVVIRRVKSLSIPILVWSIPGIIIYLIKNVNTNIDVGIVFKQIFAIVMYNLWFLWAIIFLSIFVYFIEKYLKKPAYMYLLVLLILNFIPDKYNIHLYKYMYPYFIVGYIWNKNQIFKKFKVVLEKNKYKLLCMLSVLYMILIIFYNKECYIYTTGISVLQNGIKLTNITNQVIINIYRWAIGFVGSALLLWLIYCINIPDKFKYILTKVGKESLLIYIIDDFLNKYVITRVTYGVYSLNYTLVIMLTIIIVSFCVYIGMKLELYPKLRKTLLGY